MGWNGANRIFDPVANALIKAKADDDTKRTTLRTLIKELQDGDWDTEDESLEDYLHDPAIVGAFADCNVHLSDRSCCLREPGADIGTLLTRHLVDGGLDKDVAAKHVHAYSKFLADKIRTDAALRDTEGLPELAIYGRELAGLIETKPALDW